MGGGVQAGEIERQRAGGAADDDQPQALLGHDRRPVTARLHHLTASRDTPLRKPARREVQPPAGVVDGAERDELTV